MGSKLARKRRAMAMTSQNLPAVREAMATTALDRYGPDGMGGSGYMSISGPKFSGAMGGYASSFYMDHQALRARSRLAYWESTQARALLGRITDNVIGTGLSPQSSPMWDLINNDDPSDEAVIEARHKWSRGTDTRFMMWANSTECDARGRLSLWEKQSLELLGRLLEGEVFLVFRYDDNPRRMNPLKIQSYCADQIIQPSNAGEIEAARARGNYIREGIELTPDGEEVAIFVADYVPDYYQGQGMNQGEILHPMVNPAKTVRIPFYGDSGRRFVVHSMNVENEQQVRGTPLLAGVLHELRKITDAQLAELEAMVVNALFAVWVKPGPDNPASKLTRDMTRTQSTGSSPTRSQTHAPGIVVQNLAAAEEVQSFDTKRPNLNVHEFSRAVMKGVTASMGTPISVAEMEHNASYSAARGALLQFWTKVEIWRDTCMSQTNGPIREAWFTEEVAAKRIKAPGYNGKSGIIRAAWLNCGWLGSQMPSLDAEKDARAADLRIAQGALTREKNAMQFNNSDFKDNVARLKEENEALAEANAPMQALQTKQFALPFEGGDGSEQGKDPSAPGYQPKMDPNAPEYDPNYSQGAA